MDNKQISDKLLEMAKFYQMTDEELVVIGKVVEMVGSADDDLISRQAVIDLFNSVFSDVFIPFARARMFIDGIYHAVPPVTPQQKVGRWIPYKVENEKNVILSDDLSEKETLQQQDWVEEYEPCYICSCCGKTNFYRNYCPNCGARMFDPQEREV